MDVHEVHGFQAASGGPVRATRAEAEADQLYCGRSERVKGALIEMGCHNQLALWEAVEAIVRGRDKLLEALR